MPVGLAANHSISMEKQNTLGKYNSLLYIYIPALNWRTKIIASHFFSWSYIWLQQL